MPASAPAALAQVVLAQGPAQASVPVRELVPAASAQVVLAQEPAQASVPALARELEQEAQSP